MFVIVLSFVLIGVLVGVLAGMFGFGGGLIIVPAIVTFISIHESLFVSNSMHIAVATSLFVMFFTSIKTTYAHYKANNIIWSIALKLKMGLIIGTILGATMASYLSSSLLESLFIIFLIYTVIKLVLKMLNSAKSTADEYYTNVDKPLPILLYIYGIFTGFVSVVLGIGGSIIIVPFLRSRNYRLTTAAAIASSIVPFLALFGAISYIVAGYGLSNLPYYCLGFVYLPVAISLIVGSFMGVSMGVNLSGRVSQKIQNRAYLVIMITILIVMIL
ncbi:sulfite exporter TauE/SafE family protein [Francisella salina]|uniref:Probable membrane transporter protein n=1 Tax=Francisella salina TaxID=573569 RepID=A0ABM5M9Y8_FRAST|nr:sulfite exporter TauE/SafE family protein [Francisella salina]AEI36022.1 hypothetical protein F7308_1095 [Francisella salina]